MKNFFNKKARQKLRIKTLHGHDVHAAEGGNPKSLALLARAYKDVYEAAFPIKEERESLEKLQGSLKNTKSSSRIAISILGDDLDGKKPVIKAMTIGYYYANHDVGLLAYLVTAPAFQGHGLGRAMNEANNQALLDLAAAHKKPLQGIFLECNDPAKIRPENDVMDPALRIRIYEKWGAVVLPIDYIQPPLEKGAAKCDTLKLLAYPHPKTGQYPSKDAIKGYITGIYTELAKYAGVPPEKNPDYLKSIAQLEKLDLETFYKNRKPATKPKPSSPN